MTPERGTDSPAALERLVRREEVLEICFWFQGEGFGDVFAPAALRPFLTCEEGPIARRARRARPAPAERNRLPPDL
jgi:hypothetical protein